MPGTVLPNMGIVLPVLGGDPGEWDSLINEAFGRVDSHSHMPGAGVPIRAAALDIDADVSFAGFGATNLGRTAYAAITPLTSGAQTIFVSSADNELYWRTAAGTNVKLTSGTGLNISGVGGIVGDYAAVGAEVAYDAANFRYTFKQGGSPKPWARMASGEVRIYETSTTDAVYVGLAAPSALAASYTITLPLAAPGSTSLVQLSSAGVISASNTVANALTLSAILTANGGVSATTVATSGAATVGTTLGVTGALTASSTVAVTGAVTMASTLGVTGEITATADYKHSYQKLLTIPASMARATASFPQLNSAGVTWTVDTSTSRLLFPVPVHAGDRIVSWRLRISKNSISGTVTGRLRSTDTTGAETDHGTASTQTSNIGNVALSNVGLTVDVDQSRQYYVTFEGGGTPGDLVRHLEVNYTRP